MKISDIQERSYVQVTFSPPNQPAYTRVGYVLQKSKHKGVPYIKIDYKGAHTEVISQGMINLGIYTITPERL